jgi:hypothetical protein
VIKVLASQYAKCSTRVHPVRYPAPTDTRLWPEAAARSEAVTALEVEERKMMLGRGRRLVEIVVGSIWIVMLILLIATTGPDRRNPIAEHPLVHLIWALLISAIGGLSLAERAHYVGVYQRSINRGPFRMGQAAISRLVVGTGVFLLLAGILLALISLRRLASL